MTNIVNTDTLTWIFTTYGLNRIQEAIADSSVRLNLTKIKVGDSNGSYYTPTASQTSLINEKAPFYIHQLKNDTDNHTVTFKTVIEENSSGYDIREVGIYETVNNIDYLFAISTQQPIPKPPVSSGYSIAIDYEITLISQNLSSVYSQITLDPLNTYIQSGDLNNLNNTMLFAIGNLSEQVMSNTHKLGLDRAAELNTLITENHKYISNSMLSSMHSNLVQTSGFYNIYNEWVFKYAGNTLGQYYIPDLSERSIPLNMSNSLATINSGYKAFAPYYTLDSTNYFYLNENSAFNLLNSGATSDAPFVFYTVLKFTNTSDTNIILGKLNNYSQQYSFRIARESNNTLTIKLYTDKNNYITATSTSAVLDSDKYHALIITYNGNSNNPVFSAYIDLNNKLTFNTVSTGTYTGMTDIVEKTICYEINSNNSKVNFINANVSLMGVIKDTLDETADIIPLLYQLNSLIGSDICQIF